ncbi:hypothetical protein Tco_0802941 [Tanacetum coccineum]|uniref:Uncharacterized protein n=1 Tax=Tanacetum coccineum TaxID=301880 RepID=A0ABQ5A4E1_9ASTR
MSILDVHLQIAPDANNPNPSPVEYADLVAPHANTSCNPSLVKWNWDEVILVPSDDDEANVNEPIALPVEDADVEVAPHHNPNFNPKLLNWNWDAVIVVPSDDDEGHAEEDISTFVNTQVHVKNRKHVFALIDEINACAIMNVNTKLTHTVILCPADRVSRVNVSLGMSQPNGPHDHANAETKVQIMITTRIVRPELRFAEVSVTLNPSTTAITD